MAELQVDNTWEQVEALEQQENNEIVGGMEDNDDDDDILGLNEEDEMEEQLASQRLVLMRFCPHDSSMLYPKEDKRNRRLTYACRLCRYTEASDNNLIYKNVIKKEVGNVLHTVPPAGHPHSPSSTSRQTWTRSRR